MDCCDCCIGGRTAEAIALIIALPLKTIVPYTLLVDRQTGYVQALDPIEAKRIAPDSALTQSFLVQYVIAREEFDIATVQSDYRKVALWSAENARSDYLSLMQVSNPESPLAQLPRSTLIETRVRSVSALGPKTALVRFETIRRDRAGAHHRPRAGLRSSPIVIRVRPCPLKTGSSIRSAFRWCAIGAMPKRRLYHPGDQIRKARQTLHLALSPLVRWVSPQTAA
ncbi:MAG: type IV secretion system protein [Sphingomonadales bacterium]|nr:type IV secretion system protein [Sphingomonadales bacterium]